MPFRLASLLALAFNFFFNAADLRAEGLDIICGSSINEELKCKLNKGDAYLNGRQGYMNTLVLPTGVRYQEFYTGGGPGQYQGLMVRRLPNQQWFSAYSLVDRSGDNDKVYYTLPSGNLLFWYIDLSY